MYLLLDAMHISGAVAGRSYPYLVSTISKIDAESMRYCGNTADHGGILIGHDHNADVYLSLASTRICWVIHHARKSTLIVGNPQEGPYYDTSAAIFCHGRGTTIAILLCFCTGLCSLRCRRGGSRCFDGFLGYLGSCSSNLGNAFFGVSEQCVTCR